MPSAWRGRAAWVGLWISAALGLAGVWTVDPRLAYSSLIVLAVAGLLALLSE